MNTTRILTQILLLAAALQVSTVLGADSNPPERMTYQGFLTDGTGTVLGNTNSGPKNYDVIFRIWDSQTSGAELWAEQQTLTVDKGYFSVLLGEGSAYQSEAHPLLLSSLFTNNSASDRYVEMTVKGIGNSGADVTMLPRLRLLASPYTFLARNAINAVNAVTAAGLVNSGNNPVVNITNTFVGIGKANPATTLDVNGTVSATAFVGNGAGLTNLSAANLTGVVPSGTLTSVPSASLTGIIADGRLATNVARFNTSPDSKLDVVGNIHSSLDVNVDGQVTTKGNLNSGLDVNVVGNVNLNGNVKMGPTRSQFATSSDENLRIVRGSVAPNGSITSGSGFTVTTPSGTGQGCYYLITFNTPFTGVPTVMATSGTPNRNGLINAYNATTNAVWVCFYSNDGNFYGTAISFIAIGPR